MKRHDIEKLVKDLAKILSIPSEKRTEKQKEDLARALKDEKNSNRWDEDGRLNVLGYAVSSEDYSVADYLIENGVSLNPVSPKVKRSLLLKFVSWNDVKAVDYLLRKKIPQDDYVFELAIVKHLPTFAGKFFDAGWNLKVIQDLKLDKKEVMNYKTHRKQKKQELQLTGQIVQDYSSVPQIIASSIYTDNQDFCKTHVINKLAPLYQCALLRPLMQAIALTNLGHHDVKSRPSKNKEDYPSLKHKKTKIFVCNKKTHTYLIFSETVGTYTNKSSAFSKISGSQDGLLYPRYKETPTQQVTLGSIFHETTHLLMLHIFKNSCKPYFEYDSLQKSTYQTMVKQISLKLESMTQLGLLNDDEDWAYQCLSHVFRCYTQDEVDSELIVRVPQILATLDEKRGMAALKRYPELLQYYQKVLMPKIEAYLNAQHAHILLPSNTTPQRSSSDFKQMMEYLKNKNLSAAKKIWENEETQKGFTINECQQLYSYCPPEDTDTPLGDAIMTRVKGMLGLRSQLLNNLQLDPTNTEHLRYWAQQVTTGGAAYKGFTKFHIVLNQR